MTTLRDAVESEWPILRNSLSKAHVAKDIDRALEASRQRLIDAHDCGLDVERLARALPAAINFRFLPPRVVEDPIWTEVATDVAAALREPRRSPRIVEVEGRDGTQHRVYDPTDLGEP
jgi:hypothetical protein